MIYVSGSSARRIDNFQENVSVPTIPIRGSAGPLTWEGVCARKPWQHQVTVALPCLDHADETAICVELLRCQSVPPYFILVDTGSRPDQAKRLRAMRAPDLEVHSLRINGARHPSAPIANALDLCFSLAATPYVFTTHQDCFARRPDLLEWMIRECKGHEVVGYRLTPRSHPNWDKMFGHTATLFDMAAYDRMGITWTLRRVGWYSQHQGPLPSGALPLGNWPDTESAMNTVLLAAGAKTKFLGHEENATRTTDENIDHCRSLVCSSLYMPGHHARAMGWIREATVQALGRIAEWRHLPKGG